MNATEKANQVARACKIPSEILAHIFEKAPTIEKRNTTVIMLGLCLYLAFKKGVPPATANTYRNPLEGKTEKEVKEIALEFNDFIQLMDKKQC